MKWIEWATWSAALRCWTVVWIREKLFCSSRAKFYLEQWWSTFFESLHILRVSYDQNLAQREDYDILKKKIWWHTRVPQHTGWASLIWKLRRCLKWKDMMLRWWQWYWDADWKYKYNLFQGLSCVQTKSSSLRIKNQFIFCPAKFQEDQ
jgi:hypothetical protein